MRLSDRPRLPLGVRLHHDPLRHCPVLLGPGTAMLLDPLAAGVLDAMDGRRDLRSIIISLARRHDDPNESLSVRVQDFLADLASRRLVEPT